MEKVLLWLVLSSATLSFCADNFDHIKDQLEDLADDLEDLADKLQEGDVAYPIYKARVENLLPRLQAPQVTYEDFENAALLLTALHALDEDELGDAQRRERNQISGEVAQKILQHFDKKYAGLPPEQMIVMFTNFRKDPTTNFDDVVELYEAALEALRLVADEDERASYEQQLTTLKKHKESFEIQRKELFNKILMVLDGFNDDGSYRGYPYDPEKSFTQEDADKFVIALDTLERLGKEWKDPQSLAYHHALAWWKPHVMQAVGSRSSFEGQEAQESPIPSRSETPPAPPARSGSISVPQDLQSRVNEYEQHAQGNNNQEKARALKKYLEAHDKVQQFVNDFAQYEANHDPRALSWPLTQTYFELRQQVVVLPPVPTRSAPLPPSVNDVLATMRPR